MRTRKRQRGYLLVTVVATMFLLATIAMILSLDSAISANTTTGELEAAQADHVAQAAMRNAVWKANQSACSDYAMPATSLGTHSYSAMFNPTFGSPTSIVANAMHASGTQRSLTRSVVAVYDFSMPTVGTLLPGAEGKDTFIEGADAHTDHNKATDKKLLTSAEAGKEYRTLLQFDLSGLPPTAIIQSASLELTASGIKSPDVVEAHRLLRDWTEDGVTWNSHDGTDLWNTPGGDYDPTTVATFLADSTGRKSMDITDLARAWVDGSLPNYGLILLTEFQAMGHKENTYYSSDDAAYPRPKLTLIYVCECGTPCPGIAVANNVVLSTDSDAVLGGLSFTDIDLAEYDAATDTATLLLEGTLTTLRKDIDAVHVLENGHVILSTKDEAELGGLNFQKDDLAEYDPVAGTATMYFEGRLHFTEDENIISVHVLGNGKLVLSTDGEATLGGVTFSDRDVVKYDPNTGTASIYFDGDATSLTEDITALHVLENGHLVMAAKDDTTLGGLSFEPADLIEYDHLADSAVMYLAGSSLFDDSGEKIISAHVNGDAGPGSEVLLVVGDANNPSPGEADRRALFESWGYVLRLIGVNETQPAFDTAVGGSDVVYLSDVITASALGSKLTDATVGIVSAAISLRTELGFAGSSADSSRDEIDIIDNSHSITDGFALGLTTIATSPQQFTYFFTDTAPDQQVLAETNHLGPKYKTSFVTLESGAELWGGGTAAGRRVQLPWGTGSFDIGALNIDGLTLLRRSLEWATGGGAAPTPGLLAHWKMDDAAGLTAVDSVGSNDGTLENGPGWVVGRLDGALRFDGGNDYVAAPHQADLSLTAQMTFIAWANTNNNSGGYKSIVAKDIPGNGASNYWFGMWNDELVFGFWASGGFRSVRTLGAGISEGSWTHLAASFDNATDDVRLYVNGTEVLAGSLAWEPTAETADLWIGHSVDGEYWDGMLDDVLIYERVLSAGEIAALSTPPVTLPIAHWKFDEISGTTAVDSLGGNDGTLINGPSWVAGMLDGALSFDGDNDYVDVNSINPRGYDDFTLSAWYKSADSSVSDDEYIYMHAEGFITEGVTFGPTDDSGNTDKLRLTIDVDDDADQHYGTSDIVDQQWHHLVAVRSGGRIRLYVDSTQESDRVDDHAGTSVAVDGEGPFIGDYPGGTEQVHGVLDDVRLYDRGLSDSEIAALFAAGGGIGGGGDESGEVVLLSTVTDATFGGATFGDDDVADYDMTASKATSRLDGSVFSSTEEDINAVHLLPDGRLVLSTTGNATLGGLSFGDDDLIVYDPVSDSAKLLVDGSVFSSSTEDIDAVYVLSDGIYLMSTVTDASIAGLSVGDDDLFTYNSNTGEAKMYLDGGSVFGSSDEDINAVHVLDTGTLLISTTGNADLGGLSFGDDDIVEYDTSTDKATLFLDGAIFSATNEDIDAISLQK